MWQAARDGDSTKLKELLEDDHDLANARLPLSGVTPAYVAATFGHVATLRVLDEFGADVSANAEGGVNLATTALLHGHEAVCACLQELGAPVADTSLHDLKSAVANCIRGGSHAQWTHVQAVQVLYDLGMFKDGVADGWLVEDGHDGTPMPLLCYVARHNGVEALPWWVACGGRLDVVDGNRRSAIHTAAQGDHPAVVRKLHALGLDVGAVDAAGDSAAHVAGRHGCPRVLRVLHELGANVDLPNEVGHSPAFCAAWNGQALVLGALKELGCDLEVRVGRGQLTPMYVAAQRDHTDVVARLLELGVAGDIVCALGATPADMARHRGSDNTLAVLRVHGIVPTCEEGMLPFVAKAFEAARVGEVEILSVALDLGVELVELDTCLGLNNDGQTLAYVGTVNGHGSVLTRLSEFGVLSRLRQYCVLRTHMTLAHVAAGAGKADVLRVLHELCGADVLVAARAGDGSTPAHVAAGAGKADVIRVLHELGATNSFFKRDKSGATAAHLVVRACFGLSRRAASPFVDTLKALVVGAGLAVLYTTDSASCVPVWCVKATTATEGVVAVLAAAFEMGGGAQFYLRIWSSSYHCSAHEWLRGCTMASARALVARMPDERMTAACCAAKEGRCDVLRVLRKLCGVDALVAALRHDGSTPAHVAAGAGKVDVLRVLHELCGADVLVAARARDGSTPAHVAAGAGNADVIRVLHELCGVDVLMARQYDGSTPAHVAAIARNDHVLSVLHEFGASLRDLA